MIRVNQHPETGVYGTDTTAIIKIINSIGELLCYSEAAFDHTPINYGSSGRSFTRAPRGVSNVYKAQSVNPKLTLTYVMCCSKKYGVLPGYFIIPEKAASKSLLKDLQAKGEISGNVR